MARNTGERNRSASSNALAVSQYDSATVDGETPHVGYTFRIRSSDIADQVWLRQKRAAPDAGAMEDIATDTDALDFTGQEG